MVPAASTDETNNLAIRDGEDIIKTCSRKYINNPYLYTKKKHFNAI